MSHGGPPTHWSHFVVRIVLPTVLAIGLFVVALFVIVLPSFEQTILDRKREMIRELTNSAWSVLDELYAEQRSGTLTVEQAQERAIKRIRNMRYGDDRKDYFWINDLTPRMVMHPYRTDQEGKDLSDLADPTGKKLFVEFVRVARSQGAGYVEYMWDWKDDPTRIVPKLSYVKAFEPWGWVIGTGVYIEDVREEIAALTGRLLWTSVGITGAIAVLLLLISQQSLRIERRRRHAEAQLAESRERYRTLVEAATEGLVMVLGGRFTYTNQTMLTMLGYDEATFFGLGVVDVFATDTADGEAAHGHVAALMMGEDAPSQYPARLTHKDGHIVDAVVTTSPITLAGRSGFTMIVRDISRRRRMERELGQSRNKYETLTNSINIGVFRAELDGKGRLQEANPAALRIFGLGETSLTDTRIADVLHDASDHASLLAHLREHGTIRNRMLRLRRSDGSVPIVLVSAVAAPDENGALRYCDGIIEDITERKKVEAQRESLIAELQTAMLFLNQPICHSTRPAITCDLNEPIRNAAELMAKHGETALLVTSESGERVGIVTDRDLGERVVAAGHDPARPISEVMSSPIIAMSHDALVFEAVLLMQERGFRHVAVRDATGTITSVLSDTQLMQLQRHSAAAVLQEVRRARSLDEIIAVHDRLPRLVKALIDSGSNARNITRIITTVSDLILEKLVHMAVEQLGPPPARFAFMAMGSQGRAEQTLQTDQDNAILYEDCPDSSADEVARYFARLGACVCDWLDQSGYALCKGDVMAKNPRWCQPLSQWEQYFTEWTHTAQPQELLDLKIFFDFRCIAGDVDLTDRLRDHVIAAAGHKAAFFQHLAMSTLEFRAPVGFFGQIRTGSDKEHPETFDIKMAIMPIADCARIYALQAGSSQTNTLDRLAGMAERDVLHRGDYEDVVQAYDLLMQIRFQHQVRALIEGQSPDNFINPKSLSHIELALLKKAFGQITALQSKLRFDFTGTS